ncbi:hypothetical protein [Acinetobacter sp. ANC 3813]|uniref:hypothetical protein n=1 Tax=Acinetobacter sp. ANC 3813 TaxID=1977873 RepID=UPI000A355F94|nr:hypothetical protein [Acinetobacter sp. ANC 3813]OTG87826.1 hypothetical protein B9T34_15940 [Acinetobacter sp. ANC 3813]
MPKKHEVSINVSKRHDFDVWREIRSLYESKASPSYERIKELLTIEYDLEGQPFPSKSTVLRRRKKEGWIKLKDDGSVKDTKIHYDTDFWLCVRNVYESNPKIAYKRLKETVQNELQCVDFPSVQSIAAKAKAEDWKSVEHLLTKSDAALKKIKKNVTNAIRVTQRLADDEEENYLEIQYNDQRYVECSADDYYAMIDAMKTEKSQIEKLMVSGNTAIADMAEVILKSRRTMQSVNGYGGVLLDNYMLNTQLLTSDKFMRHCPSLVIRDLEKQGTAISRAISVFSDLSFALRESIKFELSLRGVGIDDLRDVDTTKLVDDLEDEEAFEAQRERLRQRREELIQKRRHIESGGLQAECDSEVQRRMAEANLESEEVEFDEME